MNFTDVSCFLNKLKIKQKILEKNSSDFIKSVIENYGIVFDDNNITLKPQNEFQLFSLKKEVQESNKLLQELKKIVSPENIPEIDLLALKHKMLTLENSIQHLKNRITKDMDNLMKDENVLTIEVTNLEMKYSDVNKIKFEESKIISTSVIRKNEIPTLYQEVEDFANFVNDNGGHEGGWSQNDHLLFLKYFHQIKSRKMLIKILQRHLPDFSEQKISHHIDWYEEYVSLREKQKNALEEWRRNKIQINKNTDVEAKITSPEEKKCHNNNNNNQLQRQSVKEKIIKWKLEKQQKNQQETENRMKTISDNEKKSKNMKKLKRDMKNELRNDVGKWRASKQAQEKAEKLEKEVMSLKEKERKIVIANALIREFQKQDSLYIMRRINKHNMKTSNFFTPSPRKETHKNNCRDPERIFKATRQWLSRISCSDSKEYTTRSFNTLFKKGPLNVQQIPKLRIPSWRLATK